MNRKNRELYDFVGKYLMVYLPGLKVCSPNTLKSYRESLNMFLEYSAKKADRPLEKLDLNIFQKQNIAGFLDYLTNDRPCKVGTRNLRLSCLKSFLKYVMREQPIYMTYYEQASQITLQSDSKKLVPYITEEELRIVFSVVDEKSAIGQRNLVILIVMYDTGARVQEIVNLKLSDYSQRKDVATLRLLGKGGKIRLVPLMPNTVKQLDSYIKRFHPNETTYETPLFYTRYNDAKKTMSIDAIERFVKDYGKLAREKCNSIPANLHPHIFRHSRAMHLYQAGMPLTLISQWLGHANLETTLIYAFADTNMKREAIAKATHDDNPIRTTEIATIWNDDADTLKRLCGLKV